MESLEGMFIPFPRSDLELPIHVRFERQVEKHGDRLAIMTKQSQIAYQHLNRGANRIADRILVAHGQAREPVAMLLPTGVEAITAILGVLKAGKFYLGLDPRLSPEHLSRITTEAGARILITNDTFKNHLGRLGYKDEQVLFVDALVYDGDPGNPNIPTSPDDLAYIFFTSGSTGYPKGVIDTHRNVLHNIMRYTNTLAIGPADRLSLLQSPSFSGSVSSLFGAILNGACCCPFELYQKTPVQLATYVNENKVTIYHSVPTIFRSVAIHGGGFPSVRVVRLEGDQAAKIDIELFRKYFSSDALLVNGLGTTETGLVSQFFVSKETNVAGNILPVGYPVDDMEILVLDDLRKPMPTGQVGEIAVRSAYLASGYWRNPGLTAQRFTQISAEDTRRTYLTGDLGKLLHDGCLVHLGRRDSRVKLRGQPVDLAEIESALLSLENVGEAAVLLERTKFAHERLVAYYAPFTSPGPTIGVLREELSHKLPLYMLPAQFVELPTLPKSQNGKLDRNALPSPGNERPRLSASYLRSQNLVEHQLVGIWEAILQIQPIGILDDFFELGGDSLTAMTMLAKIHEDLGIELSAQLLAQPTINHLASQIVARHEVPNADVVRIQAGRGPDPLMYLHGDYTSGGFYCRRLAREIGKEITFYAFPPCGLDGAPPPPSYEEMAERHLAALRRIQPCGPYYLGGTCNGGLVAYEMARRLLADGEAVALLVLFAASASNVRFMKLKRWTERWGKRLGFSSAERQALYVRLRQMRLGFDGRDKLGKLRHAVKKSTRVLPELLSVATRRYLDASAQSPKSLYDHYQWIDRVYVPGPYAGKVTLIWPNDEPESPTEAATAWRRVATDVELRVLPSSHYACLTIDAPLLAREMASCIEQVRRAGSS